MNENYDKIIESEWVWLKQYRDDNVGYKDQNHN